jgi:MFS family permease
MRRIVENRQDRIALVEDAGLARISLASVLAGVLVGYGAFAVLAGVTAAILGSVDVNVDLTAENLAQVGTASAIALGAVLFLSYLFGGYVAGRMARRAGATHGMTVFFTGLLIAVATAGVVEATGAAQNVVDGLRSLGVPTSGEQWRQIGTVAGIASLAGMFLGSLVGGVLGERWHTKLISRALDPGVGPEARMRAEGPAVERSRQRRQEIVLPDAEGKETRREKSPAG